jgi:Rieske Fe-S protein
MDIFDPDGHRYQIQAFGPEGADYIIENVGEINCGTVSDFAIGDVKQFAKGKFFVVRLDEGFVAYSRWCTHKNGLLTWQPEHWRFYCPMHGVTYDRKGENTSFCHDVSALRMHPLALGADGTITVRPDEIIEREGFDPEQLTTAERSAATVAS